MVISLCYIKCKKVDPFGSGRSIDLVCPQITIPSPILYGQFTNISNICILQSYCCIWYHQYSNYTVRNNNVIHITIIYHVIQFYRCILYHIILSLYIYIYHHHIHRCFQHPPIVSGWYVYISTDGETWPATNAPSQTVADVNTMQRLGGVKIMGWRMGKPWEKNHWKIWGRTKIECR